jgi:hypothetical protein
VSHIRPIIPPDDDRLTRRQSALLITALSALSWALVCALVVGIIALW